MYLCINVFNMNISSEFKTYKSRITTSPEPGERTIVAKKILTNIHRACIYALCLMIKLFISTLRYTNLMFRVETLSYATQYANVVI